MIGNAQSYSNPDPVHKHNWVVPDFSIILFQLNILNQKLLFIPITHTFGLNPDDKKKKVWLARNQNWGLKINNI